RLVAVGLGNGLPTDAPFPLRQEASEGVAGRSGPGHARLAAPVPVTGNRLEACSEGGPDVGGIYRRERRGTGGAGVKPGPVWTALPAEGRTRVADPSAGRGGGLQASGASGKPPRDHRRPERRHVSGGAISRFFGWTGLPDRRRLPRPRGDQRAGADG